MPSGSTPLEGGTAGAWAAAAPQRAPGVALQVPPRGPAQQLAQQQLQHAPEPPQMHHQQQQHAQAGQGCSGHAPAAAAELAAGKLARLAAAGSSREVSCYTVTPVSIVAMEQMHTSTGHARLQT